MCDACPELMKRLADYKRNNMNQLGTYITHAADGCSWKCIQHYAQIIRAKKFQYYDYGKQKNLEIYNQPTPLEIPINNLNPDKTPQILIVSGQADIVASPRDCRDL